MRNATKAFRILLITLTLAQSENRCVEERNGDGDYNLHPVFFLGLLNFDIRHLDPEKARREQFIHKFSLREESSNEQMSRALQYAFLEIARFDKEKEACETFEERFLYMMKNLPTFAEEPELWDDPYFKEMMEEAEFANMTLAQRRQYAEAMKQRWDYRNQLTFAEQQGEARGREEGLARGREEQAVLIARRMREMGMAEETIRAATGLSAEQFRIL